MHWWWCFSSTTINNSWCSWSSTYASEFRHLASNALVGDCWLQIKTNLCLTALHLPDTKLDREFGGWDGIHCGDWCRHRSKGMNVICEPLAKAGGPCLPAPAATCLPAPVCCLPIPVCSCSDYCPSGRDCCNKGSQIPGITKKGVGGFQPIPRLFWLIRHSALDRSQSLF